MVIGVVYVIVVTDVVYVVSNIVLLNWVGFVVDGVLLLFLVVVDVVLLLLLCIV